MIFAPEAEPEKTELEAYLDLESLAAKIELNSEEINEKLEKFVKNITDRKSWAFELSLLHKSEVFKKIYLKS